MADGKLTSEVKTENYLVEDKHDIPVLCINSDPDGLFGYNNGIFADGPGHTHNADDFPFTGANFFKLQDVEREISFEWFEADGTKGVEFPAGIKIFGQYSRAIDQKSFAVYLRSSYGQDQVTYPFFRDYDVTTFKTLVLRISGQDCNSTKLRDAYFAQVVKDTMDLDYQEYRPCSVYINGEYWGLYNLREKLNENYIVSHYPGTKKGEIDLIKGNSAVRAGSDDDYKELRKYIQNHNLSNLPADDFLTVSLLGIKPDLVAGLDDHTGCPAIFHRHKSGVLCPIAVNSFRLFVFADAAFSLHAASATLGIGVFDHIPAAPAMGNHDEFLAAGNLALFGVGIVGFDDEFLHRLGRAADVEGILIDTAEAGAVPVPAVIMDMALHRNYIVADGTSEHIDSAAAYRVIASVKHKGMREDALLGAGGHIMRFVFACFKQARKLVAVALRVAAHDTVMGNPILIDPSDIVFRRSLAVFCEALISTPTLKSGNRPYSMNIK